jgi:AraC-like DNA-binding protein
MEQIKPLSKFPIIVTNNIDEAEYQLSQSIAKIEVEKVSNRHGFLLEVNEANLGRNTLHYNRFNADVEIKSGPYTDTIFFVIGGGVPTTIYPDKERLVISPQKAAIITSANQIKVVRPENSELLILRVSSSDLWHHFEKLTARHDRGSLIFDRSIDVNIGPGAMFKRLLEYLTNELDYNALVMRNSDLRRSYDEILLSALLALPHNQLEKLNKDRQYQIAPELVRRTEEYMKAHLNEAITISDLLQICSCSRSVLFSAFRNARGYTPMEFLTEQRMQSARERLLKSNFEPSVALIALDCGFINLGRFSQYYRKRFGELPSDTLRKGM